MELKTVMADTQFFYRKDTLQIDAVFRGCKTESARFKDKATYMEVNVADPPYPVTRDHKVVLDPEGNVVGTEPSPNPVQPTPTPPVTLTEYSIQSPDGNIWIITVDNMGKLGCKKK